MNPVTEAILRRRSVRTGFSDMSVPTEIILDILRCGLAAPSSKNAQPFRFHVVTDGDLLDEMACAVEGARDTETYVPHDPVTGRPRPEWPSTVLQSAAALRSARVAIFIENSGAFSRGRQALVIATREALEVSIVGYGLEILGVGAAIENMWIAAVAHGVSGVFMGDILIAESLIKARLGIECDLAGVLALGYTTGEELVPQQTRGELDPARVHWVMPPG